jgi:hypothetical protein
VGGSGRGNGGGDATGVGTGVGAGVGTGKGQHEPCVANHFLGLSKGTGPLLRWPYARPPTWERERDR